MRIAVFHAGIPTQSYARDLVNGLAAQGCHVLLITRACDFPGYVDANSVAVPVDILPVSRAVALYSRLRAKMARTLNLAMPIFPAATHRQARKLLDKEAPFDLLIGVEKAGLELAAACARGATIPYVYYSLELYIEDHPDLPGFGWQRRSEIVCHRHASATIIQDPMRWRALRHANGPLQDKAFFLPVGVPGDTLQPHRVAAAESPFPRNSILYMGMIRPSRFAGELLQAAASLPEGTTLHLHGPVAPADAARLAGVARPPNAMITTELLTEAAIRDLVAGAEIGLALYRRNNANDRLTAYSSQKIAMYLRAGVPIVAFRSEGYEELFGRFRCGEMIDSMDDLPAAIETIRLRRARYSEAAREAFAAIYNLDRYWQPLAEFLREVVER
jgi:glycosyltransferase involved in cell wall biosynthesis